MDALATKVALKWSLKVRMREDHVFGTSLHTLQASCALVCIYVVGTLFVLRNALYWADLGTLSTLGASAHVKHARIRELRHYGQARLLRVVLLKKRKGASQLTQPAPRALRAISFQMHSHLLLSRLIPCAATKLTVHELSQEVKTLALD